MTDLVQKLVGALQDCLDDSHQVLAQIEQMYGMNYRQDRLEAQRKTIADAEAALSAAKDGGWVAVPGAVYEDGGVSLIRRGTEDERCRTRGAVRLYAPLPNPPKEQA